MDVSIPRIVSIDEVPRGSLFFHLSAGTNVLCIAGGVDAELSGGDDLIVVPLRYDGHPDSLGYAINARNFGGKALIVENPLARVVPSSSQRYNDGSVVFAGGDDLYLPVMRGQGFIAGYISLSTGQIVSYVPDAVGFSQWEIVDSEDTDRVIWSSGGASNDEEQE